MNIIESIMTKNPCYTAGKTITVKGLMLHSVGCAQPKASAFISSWNSASYTSACVHAFIDGNSGDIYQTLPWNRRGWHCGSGTSGSGNNTHIGVEMCEPGCITYTSGASFTCSDTTTAKAVAKRTYEAAVELFAYLCKEYSLDPTADGVIISHKEGCARGIASNHGDPEHLWTGLGLTYTMDTFRAAVKAAMTGTTAAAATDTAEEATTGTTIDKSDLPTAPFNVRVLVDNLNIRKSASSSAAVVGQTGKGTFTITKKSNGWGKLKSGAGWIYLLNTAYCVVVTDTAAETTETAAAASTEYQVKVSISNLCIRKGPGTNYSKTGKYTGKGTFTIVKTQSGTGSTAGWGLLKAYEKNEDGWISLDYATKV